ncbi:MAG: ribonuclease HI family protein [Methanolobus sp.]|uniref:ribonuclease HI family protein n=1 Tax=Methanolobus sp. TaxID=1874737 RepID=UPI00272FC67C|nr:ribonuclease HI family protein [Methanolobus sp.]MDP2216293.1 ribonuclease HI family protein [Methanolobus sp.]
MDKLNFDGSCDPNPGGRMGFGWVISWKSKKTSTEGRKEKQRSPANTNNVAEYTALKEGIVNYLELGGKGPLLVCGDSQLVISQMSGKWNINNENLAIIKEQIASLIQSNGLRVTFKWIPRGENSIADRLAMPGDAPARPIERKVIADVNTSKALPLLRIQINELNAHPSPGFKSFAGLKVGGMDAYSRIKLEDLKKQAGVSAAALVQKDFPLDELHQASALRWMLRGLAADLAIRKVKTDIELGNKRAKGNSKR